MASSCWGRTPQMGKAAASRREAAAWGQGQDAALAVPTGRQRSQTGVVQPLLGFQPVVQQVVKREAHIVRIKTVPGQMQGGHGKARFAQGGQQRPVLKGREHVPG